MKISMDYASMRFTEALLRTLVGCKIALLEFLSPHNKLVCFPQMDDKIFQAIDSSE